MTTLATVLPAAHAGFPILSLIILAPVVAVFALLFTPANNHRAIRTISTLGTAVSLVGTIYVARVLSLAPTTDFTLVEPVSYTHLTLPPKA